MTSAFRILLAEDNDVNARLLVALMEKAGYEVTRAIDGIQAVKYAKAGDFDLILMDVNMPEMSGLEATRLIRDGAAPMRTTVILALTADDDPATQRQCIQSGMDGFVTKPINMETLLNTCEQGIRQGQRRVA